MSDTTRNERLRVMLRGMVQGVGFRPFVYRVASELSLQGWVANSVAGVCIEAEGAGSQLRTLLSRLEQEKPPGSYIENLETTLLDPVGYRGFEIRASETRGEKVAIITPDLATCPACRAELFDPQNRRYGYPFTNCTHCGPRYSIIESLPYDRPNTTMRQFTLCAQCQAEYDDPTNRRFHAQPNACPQCGPHLELWDRAGRSLETGNAQALQAAASLIRQGRIVAVKGLGGFHLMVDANNPAAIGTLRERKRRDEKPFALMFPSPAAAREFCAISPAEERLLRSPESPIVLLWRRSDSRTAHCLAGVAPGNPYLGVMLPYTPLHHLLMAQLAGPVVATSGNLSDEPICIEEHEAVCRLNGIADAFLIHNRPIARHVDDSVIRIVMDRELMLRRARGYAPLPLPLKPWGHPDPAKQENQGTVLAAGAQLKNTIALAKGSLAFVSQHIGDLETCEAHEAFLRVATDLPRLYDTTPALVAADLHPDYQSTRQAHRLAEAQNATLIPVQHHVAHVLSCMAENELQGPVLGVAWDGTGLGTDGTIWGGEFLLIQDRVWRRVAHWRCFRLPGGERAIKEPRRAALGILYEMFGPRIGEHQDIALISQMPAADLAAMVRMLERRLNTPATSSTGRLFDAVSALLGLRQVVRHEGQAAMELEFCLSGECPDLVEPYPLALNEELLDWGPMIESILSDLAQRTPIPAISRRFHETLAAAVALVAQKIGCERVALSGGCFQNQVLTRRTVARLRAAGCQPYWHQRVPPNDGGIALGQAAAARWGITAAPDQGSHSTR